MIKARLAQFVMRPDADISEIRQKARELSANWSQSEYAVITDESERSGRRYSYFYGGLLIPKASVRQSRALLSLVANKCGLNGEIKWTKTAPRNLEAYIQMASVFMVLVEEGVCRLRVAYNSNEHLHAASVKRRNNEALYLKLYHNFILRGFALTRANLPPNSKDLTFLMDRLPVGVEDGENFAKILCKIPNQWALTRCKVPDSPFTISHQNICEIDSATCLLLQMVDMVTGAMFSLANEMCNQPGSGIETKRGRAKSILGQHILTLIKQLTRCPNLTVHQNSNVSGSWFDVPYRHWIVESRS